MVKSATKIVGADEQNSGDPQVVLLDKKYDFPKGQIVVRLDLRKILGVYEQYRDHLIYARGLPYSGNVSLSDPLYEWIIKHMPWVRPEAVMAMAKSHYEKFTTQADAEAWMLATTVDSNLNGIIPEPYEPEIEEAIPGIVQLPSILKNLEHPVEARLKVILDVMSSDQPLAEQMMKDVEVGMIEAKRLAERKKKDADGFRS